MLKYLKSLLEHYEFLVAPKFNEHQQQVFDFQPEWLIQLHLSQRDHQMHYQMAWDLRTWKCPTKRSWLAPWKKYKFIWLLKPKSAWNVMISSPVMFDKITGQELSGYDIAQLYINVYNGEAEDPKPWFAPAGSFGRSPC